MQRDQRYDILKGIAIIMMVAFHAHAPLMQGDYSQLAGAFWFRQSLLLASVGCCVSSWLFKMLKFNVRADQLSRNCRLHFATLAMHHPPPVSTTRRKTV